ncbi:MAG: MFS transporter [Candidatus Dormibacteria bacterium]
MNGDAQGWAGRAGILGEGRFLIFSGGQGISSLGDSIYFIALAWTALTLTHSPVYLGLLLTTTALPRALLILGGGVLVDRWGARRVILGSDASRAVLILALAALLWLGHGSIAALFVVAAVFGVFDALFYPATTTIIPSLVRPEHLSSANAVWQVAVQGSMILGPPVGGVLVGLAGPGVAFTADGISFLVAFSALLLIRAGGRRTPDGSGPQTKASGGLRHEVMSGLRVVGADPFLRALMPVAAVLNLAALGPINVGIPLLARAHHWGAGGYGLLEGGFGAGILLGGVALGVGLKLPRLGLSVMVLVGVQAVFLGLLGLAGSLPVGVGLCALMGVLLSAINVSVISLVQVVAPPDLLGRVSSVLMFASMSLTPVSYALAGGVVAAIGVPGLFLSGAGLEIAVALAGSSSPAIRAGAPPAAKNSA